jgi:hypothetical protein
VRIAPCRSGPARHKGSPIVWASCRRPRPCWASGRYIRRHGANRIGSRRHQRKPSHLGSCSQSSPFGGRTAALGEGTDKRETTHGPPNMKKASMEGGSGPSRPVATVGSGALRRRRQTFSLQSGAATAATSGEAPSGAAVPSLHRRAWSRPV